MDSTNTPTLAAKPLSQMELNEMLIEAAKNGQADLVKSLIAKGADVLNPKEGGIAHIASKSAALHGHVDVVSMLLPYVEPLVCYDLLQSAGINGHVNVVNALFPYLNAANTDPSNETKDYFKKTAFNYAVQYGHVDVVKTLLTHFGSAFLLNTPDLFRNGNTPLIIAAENGNLKVIDTLITAGADIAATNSSHLNALEMAALTNKYDAALRLLSAMPAHSVINFQQHTFNTVGYMATQCRQAVMAIQNEIFGTFSLFRSKMLPTNQPGIIDSVLTYLFPDWYRHRAPRDTGLIFSKIQAILNLKAENAKEKKRAHVQTSPALLMAPPAATYLPALTTVGAMPQEQQQANVVLAAVDESEDVIEQGRRSKKAKQG